MAETEAKRSETPIELVYSTAFKRATAEGEHRQGAHIRGLDAVHDWALAGARHHPLRMAAAKGALWLYRTLRPEGRLHHG